MDKFEKDKMIKKEIKILKSIFKDIDKDKLSFVDKLIEQVAFMKTTLLELNDEINTNGTLESYTSGQGEVLRRESASSKVYNTMIKNYNSTMKQLIDFIPEKEVEETKDELLEFIKR